MIQLGENQTARTHDLRRRRDSDLPQRSLTVPPSGSIGHFLPKSALGVAYGSRVYILSRPRFRGWKEEQVPAIAYRWLLGVGFSSRSPLAWVALQWHRFYALGFAGCGEWRESPNAGGWRF